MSSGGSLRCGLALLLAAAGGTGGRAQEPVPDPHGVPVPTQVSAGSAFHDASLLADLNGRWSGAGSATYTDGTVEKLNCVAAYERAAVPGQMRESIRCTGAAMTLKLDGTWAIRNGAINGSWTEETHSLAGKLSGRAVASGFDFKATSTFADASVTVRMSGCAQNIVMTFTQQIDRMRLTLRKC